MIGIHRILMIKVIPREVDLIFLATFSKDIDTNLPKL